MPNKKCIDKVSYYFLAAILFFLPTTAFEVFGKIAFIINILDQICY